MEEARHDVHAARFDLGGLRVLVLVDHVLGERLAHELLGLGLHPGGDEGREVQAGVAVEHELVVDQVVGRARLHLLGGDLEARNGAGQRTTGVGGGERGLGVVEVREFHELVHDGSLPGRA